MAVNTVSTASPVQWQLITSTTISGTPTSVTFNSFAGYQTLLLTCRNVLQTNGNLFQLTFNSDTSAGSYTWGTGGAGYTEISSGGGPSSALSTYAIISDVDKTIPHRIESKFSTTSWAVDYYTNPVAITSLTVTLASSDTFTAGTFYLYGIAA